MKNFLLPKQQSLNILLYPGNRDLCFKEYLSDF